MQWVQLYQSLSNSELPALQRYAVVAREAGESVSTIRRWVKECLGLDPGDWLVALAPRYQGCQVEATISPDAYNFIKGEFFQLTKPALKSIYRRAQRLAKEQGWTLPSYATVKRMIAREPHWLHVLKREGRDALAELFPAQKRNYSTLCLHELWCADGRMADVFVRWPDGEVSRPIVLAWIELRSRVVLGYCIGRVESADLIRLAFKDAAEKSRALPEAVLMDNGRGFASKLLTGGVPNRYRFSVREEDIPGIFPLMGIRVVWAMPENARAKPIESWWRTLAEADKRFPGAYVGHRPDARPEDCDPKKAVPIDEYRKVLGETLRDYHARPHRGDAMDNRCPREVYEDLLSKTAVRQPTREQLRLCMLAAQQVKLDPREHSVRILGNRYYTQKLAALPPEVPYVVRFNPENATEPVAVYRGEQFICEAPLVERTGFRDQQAAKSYARAKRGFVKSRVQQANAVAGMGKAASWLAARGGEEPNTLESAAAQAMLPVPKIVKPVRPERDYRAREAEEPAISQDEFIKVVTDQFKNRRAGGET